MKKNVLFGVLLISIFSIQSIFANNSDHDKKVYTLVGGSAGTVFSDDNETKKIMHRNDIQDIGAKFAEQGLYEQALVKYREALDPSLLNHDYEQAVARGAIVRIYQRQGEFEKALKEYQWFINQNKVNNAALESQKELLSLLEAKKTGSDKPVYDHIDYIRKSYKKYIPPQSKGDSGFHQIPINDIIHLYDWMGDAEGGIKFMDEVLSSKTLYPNERKEYGRVKAAFEEDKRTGHKHHLRKVIETSDIIGW